MSLFNNDNRKPKWQCFVCGREYLEFQDFKSHIIDEHEEGREYIVCKVCKTPIRDMRIHFRAKHPSLPVPKTGQMKALVWNDPVNNKGKKGKKKVAFKAGGFESLKNEGRIMNYRSSWELDVYMLLEEWGEVAKYDVEAFNVPYIWKNEWHRYYPDIKIQFIDGSVEVWEIKPQNQTTIERNQVKWKAAAQLCQNFGWTFKVKTEKGIHQLKDEVIKERRQP